MTTSGWLPAILLRITQNVLIQLRYTGIYHNLGISHDIFMDG